jgi:hypothetical protein
MQKKFSKAKLLSIREELNQVLEKLGYEVIYDRGNFKEGMCTVKSDKKIVINKLTPLDLQIDFVTKLLSKTDISNIYIVPEIREIIESYQDVFNSRRNR